MSSASGGSASSAAATGSGGSRTAAGAAAPTAKAKGTSGAAAGPTATTTPGAPTPGAPAPGAAAADKPPIVIGNIGDYSGIIGTLMKGGNVMAAVVARYINERGGLDGHPMQVVTGDAGGDPARALSLVRDMVENKGVVALMGNLWVFSANGPRQYLEEHKVPVIGGDGTTRVWDQSPMYFSSGSPYPAMALGALKGLVDMGHKKQAIIYCVEAEQCPAWRDIAKAEGRQVRRRDRLRGPGLAGPARLHRRMHPRPAQRGDGDPVRHRRPVDRPPVEVLRPAGLQAAVHGHQPGHHRLHLQGTDAGRPDGAAGELPLHLGVDAGRGRVPDTRQRLAPSLANSPAVATVWAAGGLLREAVKGAPLPAGKVTSRDFLNGLYTIRDNTIDGLSGAPLTLRGGPDPKKLVNCLYYIRLTGAKWTAPYGSKSICMDQ